MSKLKYIIPVMLITLVLTGASCGEDNSSSKKKKKVDIYEEYSSAENVDWGFEVKYPDDWEQKVLGNDATGYTIAFLSPPSDESDIYSENVIVYASLAQPQDFDEIMQQGIAEMTNSSEVNLLSYKKIFLAGKPTYVMEYSTTSNSVDFRYRHYFVNAGKNWYQVLYTAEINEYEKSLDIAESIINSLTIN